MPSIARRQLPGTPREPSCSPARAPSSETCAVTPRSAPRLLATSSSTNQPLVLRVTPTRAAGQGLDQLQGQLRAAGSGSPPVTTASTMPEVERLAHDVAPLVVAQLRRALQRVARRVGVTEAAAQVAGVGDLELGADRPLGHGERLRGGRRPSRQSSRPRVKLSSRLRISAHRAAASARPPGGTLLLSPADCSRCGADRRAVGIDLLDARRLVGLRLCVAHWPLLLDLD